MTAAEKDATGWSPAQWAFVVLWPAIASAAFAWIMDTRVLHLDVLRADVAARPPIAVIDVDAAVTSKLGGAQSSNESLDAAQQSVQNAARKLRGAGYIVLDAKNVFAYPKDFEAAP